MKKLSVLGNENSQYKKELAKLKEELKEKDEKIGELNIALGLKEEEYTSKDNVHQQNITAIDKKVSQFKKEIEAGF